MQTRDVVGAAEVRKDRIEWSIGARSYELKCTEMTCSGGRLRAASRSGHPLSLYNASHFTRLSKITGEDGSRYYSFKNRCKVKEIRSFTAELQTYNSLGLAENLILVSSCSFAAIPSLVRKARNINTYKISHPKHSKIYPDSGKVS